MYVDDLHILGSDFLLINKLKARLALKFKTTDLNPITYYLEMEVLQEDDAITVMQTIYINQLLNIYQMRNCNFISIFIVKKLCLAPVYDNFNLNLKDISAYKKFITSIQ